jgi:hypothetical protein
LPIANLRHRLVLIVMLVPLAVAGVLPAAERPPGDLPVDAAYLARLPAVKSFHIRNLILPEQLLAALGPGQDGLVLDLRALKRLVDGSRVDPHDIYGAAFFGPYPFEGTETRFRYKRFRERASVRDGRAVLRVGRLLEEIRNSEGWRDRGTILIRFELFVKRRGRDRSLGVCDVVAAFVRESDGYRRPPWLTGGPRLQGLSSADPTRATVAFRTDRPALAEVILDDGRVFTSPAGREHAVQLEGLQPGSEHAYRVQVGEIISPRYRFRAALRAGQGPVVLACFGDTREAAGDGERALMGVSFHTVELLAAQARLHGADFVAVGGDLVIGHTSSRADFRTQLGAWELAVAGFACGAPVYPVMGNHDALLRVFELGGHRRLSLDRWPYATDSAEAVFGEVFGNPGNGPRPADPRLPPYRGTVYTIQQGLVRLIAFNNNYWYADDPAVAGGSPEGYILEDQMRWLEQELDRAEADSTVRWVFLLAQEPVMPCGGHVDDAMFYDGDNNVRAYVWRDGALAPEPQGILEVRNHLLLAAARCRKVAAVLGGDEHAYCRLLVGPDVPVGDVARDDRNGDGRIAWRDGEPASPLRDLPRAVWFVTSGGGGAHYYAEQPTPWTDYWRAQPDPRRGFRYSSQENLVIFRATAERVGLQAFNPYGELIDEVPDLAAAAR